MASQMLLNYAKFPIYDVFVYLKLSISFKPLSPKIHLQILRETDLSSWENQFFKDQSIFRLVTTAFILVNFSFNYVLMLLGENLCWSLLGHKIKSVNKPAKYGKTICYSINYTQSAYLVSLV